MRLLRWLKGEPRHARRIVDDKLPEERGVIGQGQKEIAEKAALKMLRERSSLGLLAHASDEIRQLRFGAFRIRNRRGFRKTAEKRVRLVRHGQSIGYLRALSVHAAKPEAIEKCRYALNL